VVSDPNDTGILEATDEFYPELGMPSHALNEFRYIRESYNAKNPVRKHNEAFIKANLDGAYTSHLQFNEEAQQAVEEIAERVVNGEDITLVCFEKPPKKCHRYILQDHIRKRVDEITQQSRNPAQ
jgi:hypothetical protein